jgi:hypothetical protein
MIRFTVPIINPVPLLCRGDKGDICSSFCELLSTILLHPRFVESATKRTR